MPDVGMFSATEPVPVDTPVVIKFSVEVGGLPVYQESYDVDKLRHELDQEHERATALWTRRLKCVTAARDRPGFSAALTRCLVDGRCLDHGSDENSPQEIDALGVARPPGSVEAEELFLPPPTNLKLPQRLW
jgi:hypothetical protein